MDARSGLDMRDRYGSYIRHIDRNKLLLREADETSHFLTGNGMY